LHENAIFGDEWFIGFENYFFALVAVVPQFVHGHFFFVFVARVFEKIEDFFGPKTNGGIVDGVIFDDVFLEDGARRLQEVVEVEPQIIGCENTV